VCRLAGRRHGPITYGRPQSLAHLQQHQLAGGHKTAIHYQWCFQPRATVLKTSPSPSYMLHVIHSRSPPRPFKPSEHLLFGSSLLRTVGPSPLGKNHLNHYPSPVATTSHARSMQMARTNATFPSRKWPNQRAKTSLFAAKTTPPTPFRPSTTTSL